MNIYHTLKDQGNRVRKGFIWIDGDGPENIKIADKIKRRYDLT
ncbi:MAG TPA: hypothetical protein VNX68_05395 [Nitrosopumilaceae archaeon]|nr:hypothetical protein [Nitrosopumilaceae archaeon]